MTSKGITRKHFLKLGAGMGAAALLVGCAGDDTGDDTGNDSGTNPTTTGTDPTTTTGTPPGTTTDDAESSGDPTTTGDEPTGDSTGAAGGCEGGEDPGITIGTNHGHALVVPLADVMAGAEATYDIMGTSMHTHSVTLSAEDMTTLGGGGEVTVVSGDGGGHTHEVTVSCGA